jgi:hypothetical protein
MDTTFRWDPSRLNAAIARGNRVSFEVAHRDALARRKAKTKTGIDLDTVSSSVAVMKPTGLQATFERGREGGYEVLPKKGTVLTITSGPLAGRVVRSVTGGPMRPYPAMGPASQTWARGGYNTVQKQNLAASGFR